MNQAEVLSAHIRQYRKTSSCTLDANGYGMNGGAVYFHLNDLWPTMSWSSIDSLGHLKAMYYAVERLFRHEILIPYVSSVGSADLLDFYYVNDRIPQLREADTFCPGHADADTGARIRAASRENADRAFLITCHHYNNWTVGTHWNSFFKVQDALQVRLTPRAFLAFLIFSIMTRMR